MEKETSNLHEGDHLASPTKSISTGKSKNRPFPIVCIGGSAGAFTALEVFFTHMPVDAGLSFVVVMHLNPLHVGSIADLIQNFTSMPVCEAEDGMLVQPDHVYVIPPNVDMGIHNQKLLLLAPQKPHRYSMPIDYFLQSLAEDQYNKAVAIILSGMGSDGETGLRMVKEKLGMVMVQDPGSAQYTGMPQSAISTNLVDYILLPEEMPIKLIQYLNHPLISEDPEDIHAQNRDSNSIQKILMLLRSHNGHDFSLYKKNTIIRRIDRRLAFHQLPDYLHYIDYLRENPHEIDVLFNELLIGVTKFFRDQLAFESLAVHLQSLLRQKKENEPVRVWVAGCSTGEEAYSIAMLIMEFYGDRALKKIPKIQVFATDLDMEAIEHARVGVYLDNIIADVSPERIDRFFVKGENGYMVKKELREMIVFAQHNLIKDAPFTKLDLLSCRNVLIYLTSDLQKKLIPIFHYSLQRKGILFMGPAETVSGYSEMFQPLDAKWKLFERKEGVFGVGKLLDFPFSVSKQPQFALKAEEFTRSPKRKTLAETFAKVLLDNYTPTSVLVDHSGDILYINGKTGKFLELNSGEAAMNIYQMAKEELKYALGNAIHQVRTQKQSVSFQDIKIKEDHQIRLVNLKVTQLNDAALEGLILVLFEDKGYMKRIERKQTATKDLEASGLVEELEKELIYTKLQLNTTIEQMETSLEELKSTNEELQSTNEELQSTNEESLTTKEEMQSLNEELMAINLQYQQKAEELTRLNNDMKNLLDNTEIGTIFLDIHLVILRYTPQVKKLLNVIPSDIGRSINDIAFNFDYPQLSEDIEQVIETLGAKEREVQTKVGEWYNLRIMPYRTIDNFINGAVLTFTKINALKTEQAKLALLMQVVTALLEDSPDPTLLLDKDLQVLACNRAYLHCFVADKEDVVGLPLAVLAHESWRTSKLDPFIKQFLTEETHVTFHWNRAQAGPKHLTVTGTPFKLPQLKEALFVLVKLRDLHDGQKE